MNHDDLACSECGRILGDHDSICSKGGGS